MWSLTKNLAEIEHRENMVDFHLFVWLDLDGAMATRDTLQTKNHASKKETTEIKKKPRKQERNPQIKKEKRK